MFKQNLKIFQRIAKSNNEKIKYRQLILIHKQSFSENSIFKKYEVNFFIIK